MEDRDIYELRTAAQAARDAGHADAAMALERAILVIHARNWQIDRLRKTVADSAEAVVTVAAEAARTIVGLQTRIQELTP